MSAAPVLMVEDLRRLYGSRLALDMSGQTFCVYPAEIIGIMGHNGSGKSTLMRVLALLENPDSGRMSMDNELIWATNSSYPLSRHPRILALRRQVTLLMQVPYLLSRSVADNVAYGLDARGVREPERSSRVRQALTSVGLDPAQFLKRRRNELSGGEAQRVALAARLAIRPAVLLMDEPTSGVDVASSELIAAAVRNASDNGTSVVIVSHDADWLVPLCGRICKFRGGKMLGRGNPSVEG